MRVEKISREERREEESTPTTREAPPAPFGRVSIFKITCHTKYLSSKIAKMFKNKTGKIQRFHVVIFLLHVSYKKTGTPESQPSSLSTVQTTSLITQTIIMSTEQKAQPTVGEILDKAAKSAMRGGTAGAVAMGLNVGALMWMRTTVRVCRLLLLP